VPTSRRGGGGGGPPRPPRVGQPGGGGGGARAPLAPLVASVAGCVLGCLGGGVEEEGVKPSMEGESGGGRVGPNV
jgi:hypothetical protein